MDNLLGILNKGKIKESLEILLNKMMTTIKKKINYIIFGSNNIEEIKNIRYNFKHIKNKLSALLNFGLDTKLQDENLLETIHT